MFEDEDPMASMPLPPLPAPGAGSLGPSLFVGADVMGTGQSVLPEESPTPPPPPTIAVSTEPLSIAGEYGKYGMKKGGGGKSAIASAIMGSGPRASGFPMPPAPASELEEY